MPFAEVDLASITPLTMQQVFDNALNGVVKQECFSALSSKGCFYNHPENPDVHCGIGHSIPPNWQAPEAVNVSALIRHDPRIERLFFGVPGGFSPASSQSTIKLQSKGGP